jgi:hypothetical protein
MIKPVYGIFSINGLFYHKNSTSPFCFISITEKYPKGEKEGSKGCHPLVGCEGNALLKG